MLAPALTASIQQRSLAASFKLFQQFQSATRSALGKVDAEAPALRLLPIMWNRIKNWWRSNQDSSNGEGTPAPPEYKWYDVGPENPFGVRVLDVRSLTWHVVAATSDDRIAQSFSDQRASDGSEYLAAVIENSQTVACQLTFPHNGDPLEGIVFKADSMDVKWDIYIYESVFLFVRSWTGQLQYRATARIGADSITISSIEAPENDIDTAPQAVYFLLGTHAMKRVLPHTMPPFAPPDEQSIALMSFSMYGNLACYATFDDVTKVPIRQGEP